MSIMFWNPLIWSGLNNFIETMMFGGGHLLKSIEEAMLNVTNVSGQVVLGESREVAGTRREHFPLPQREGGLPL